MTRQRGTSPGRRPTPAGARAWLWVGLALAAVVLLGVSSVRLAPAGSSVAVWWPAAGVAAALLARTTSARRPAVFVLLLATITSTNLLAGREPVPSVVFGAAGALEALVFVAVWEVRGRPAALRTLTDVVRLVGASLLAAPVVGVAGAWNATAYLDGAALPAFRAVTAAHAAALLLVVPVVLLVPDRPRAPSYRGRMGVELAVQLLATAVVVGALFAPGQSLPLAFVTLPFLVWGALRFPPRIVALELLGVAAAVTLLTRMDGGPFAAIDQVSPEVVGSAVQGFLVVCVLSTLPLTVAVAQRAEALEEAVASRAALEGQRDLTAAILDASASLVVVLDRGARVVRANPAVERLAGVGRGELVGRDLGRLVVDDAAVRELLAGTGPGASSVLELRWRDREEGVREVVGTVGRLPPGHDGHVVLTGIDVADQRRSEGLLRSVLGATTGTAIVGADRQGRLTFFNVGAEEMLGYRSDEVVGRVGLLDLHDPGQVADRAAGLLLEPGLDAIVDGVRLAGAPDRRDWTWIGADGRRVTVSLTVSAMTGRDGVVHGFLGVAEDVTERREAEQALVVALEQQRTAVAAIVEVERLKADFVATTSHELRTPLTSVLGFTQLLAQGVAGPVTDAQLDILTRVDRSGRRLLGLVENLLTLGRVEAGREPLHRRRLDLDAVVRSAVEAVEEVLRPRRLDVVVTRSATPARVDGDHERLERAVINLLTNAIKFTADGGRVEVAVSVEGAEVLLTVADSGIGIPPDELGSLFQRFFRASTATEAAVPGTGLGLAIVRAVVDAHGATIAVTSTPGEGTRFALRFPLV